MSLPILPVQPDPLDPRTPAILVWRNANIHSYVLVWRKRTNEFSVSTNATTSSYPNLTVWTPDCDSIGLMGEWNPIKFREAPVYLRRIMLGSGGNSHRLIRDLAQNSRGRMVPMPANDRADFMYRGRRLMYGWSFLRIKMHYASWSAPIREALQVYSDGTWRDHYNAKAALVTFANGIVRHDLQGRFVEAVNGAFSDAGHDYPITVADCGHAEDPDDTTTDHAGSSYCSHCAEDLREIDGEYYTENECYYWESDGEYHTCEEPEEYEEDEDNDEPYSGRIQGWSTPANANRLDHFKPALTSPHTDFTLGVELEAECESSRDFSEAVTECHEYFNADYRYAMFKRDGSLSDRGFEIVTAARLLPDHLKQFSEWTPHETMQSWKPGNCGTHVHIDSRAFSALTLGKFLMFINADHNVPLIKAIAGRHPRDDSKAQSYCAQLGQEVLGDPSKALKSNNNSRYRMVNVTNLSYDEQRRLKVENTSRDCKGDYSTVELRIFRASLKKERHLAQIEFAHAAVVFCRSVSWHALTGDDFKRWLGENADSYKNLARWFGLRVVKADKRKAAPVVVRELEAECA